MGKKLYNEEFKNKAVKLSEKKCFDQAAKDLGISPGSLRRWKSGKVNPKMRSLEEAERARPIEKRERLSQKDQRGSNNKLWNFCPGPSQRFKVMKEL